MTRAAPIRPARRIRPSMKIAVSPIPVCGAARRQDANRRPCTFRKDGVYGLRRPRCHCAASGPRMSPNPAHSGNRQARLIHVRVSILKRHMEMMPTRSEPSLSMSSVPLLLATIHGLDGGHHARAADSRALRRWKIPVIPPGGLPGRSGAPSRPGRGPLTTVRTMMNVRSGRGSDGSHCPLGVLLTKE